MSASSPGPEITTTTEREIGVVPESILEWAYLGRVDYPSATRLQEDHRARMLAGEAGPALYLLEHPPVITLGRRARPEEVLLGAERLGPMDIEIERTSRGGAATYHGPGQLVGYPILHLGRLRLKVPEYVWILEEALIHTLVAYGVEAGRDAANRGVWVGREKVAAVGIHLDHRITIHGFALNLDPDLSHFAAIVPCGLRDCEVTSVKKITGQAPSPGEAAPVAAQHLSRLLGLKPVEVTRERP